MLKVEDLCVNYGDTRVISELNFELANDEILMLVGPTGCGKSTILQALAGLVPIVGGQITFGNWKATSKQNVAPEKRNVGMVFQDFALFPHLTVEQNIMFKLSDAESADHWIKLLGLEAFRKSMPSRLSGGQKQRVALARTLAHKPNIVLLDEPLSNLDAALKDSLRWEIREALKAAKVPAIWVTHDQDEALSVGDRIGVLKDGKLAQLDTPEGCFCKPKNKFVARFLGEASFLPGNYQAESSTVKTSLGTAPAFSSTDDIDKVELLLRPDDLSLSSVNQDEGKILDGNGVVKWVRYEGSSRFYAVSLDDGTEVSVRVSHENKVALGDRVQLAITTTHPLAMFAV